MNFNAPAASGISITSNFKHKIHKKCRHKRRKNKFKNSRRKNSRKFFTMNGMHDNNNFQSKKLQFRNHSLQQPFNSNLTSNWYWTNYKKAFDWHGRQGAAHWKACALALKEENEYLRQIIQKYLPNTTLNIPIADFNENDNDKNKLLENKSLEDIQIKTEKSQSSDSVESQTEAETDSYFHSQSSEKLNEDEDEEEEVEFEMSEEMIQFFEESFKHKMNFKKQEEELERKNEINKKVTDIKNNRLKRNAEMKLLYGDDASKITGMETAVQLSFDRYCDTKSPKYWPNIPLKL